MTLLPIPQWLNASALDLNTTTSDIWCINLDQQDVSTTLMLDMLSSSEQARFKAFKQSQAAQRYLFSRYAMRSILARYLAITPQQLTIERIATGKPYVAQAPLAFGFNLSHCQDLAVLAINRQQQIGVDVEYYKTVDNIDRIAKRMFSPAQQAQLAACSIAERDHLFIALWTQMEARQKAHGEGIFGKNSHSELITIKSFSHQQRAVISVALTPPSNADTRFIRF